MANLAFADALCIMAAAKGRSANAAEAFIHF